MPALDRDAAHVITGSEHILKAYAEKHSLTATAIKDLIAEIPREASADSRPDSGTGSRLFEINMWTRMWRYGRTFPREISVDQAVELRKTRVQESRALAAETLRHRCDESWANIASVPQ